MHALTYWWRTTVATLTADLWAPSKRSILSRGNSLVSIVIGGVELLEDLDIYPWKSFTIDSPVLELMKRSMYLLFSPRASLSFACVLAWKPAIAYANGTQSRVLRPCHVCFGETNGTFYSRCLHTHSRLALRCKRSPLRVATAH